MSEEIEVYTRRVEDPFRYGVGIWIKRGDAYAKPVTMEKMDLGLIVDPLVTLDQAAAQSLIDGLWDAGLRPTEGHGSAGQMAAVRGHLDDMRAIAFHKLNIVYSRNGK